jgi:hypothetical protein
MWHIRKTKEVQRGFWWGDLWERRNLANTGGDGDNIKMDLQEF